MQKGHTCLLLFGQYTTFLHNILQLDREHNINGSFITKINYGNKQALRKNSNVVLIAIVQEGLSKMLITSSKVNTHTKKRQWFTPQLSLVN